MIRDIRLEKGDIVCNSAGNCEIIRGTDAMFQRAVICIKARLNSFIYDKTLGSSLDSVSLNGELARDNAELIINEALARLENTYARVLELGKTAKLLITINGESRTEEVDINADI